MQLPALNINGTSPLFLITEYRTALAAVTQALQKVRDVEVHARDYQTIPGRQAAVAAIREHQIRISSLEKVHEELKTIYIDLCKQAGTTPRLP